MGRKERREREQKRENYASRHTAQKRKQVLIAAGVFAAIGVIVGYAAIEFMNIADTPRGAPEGAGALGSDHAHAGMLVKIFGDEFDFSAPAYQIKSNWIHFEGSDGTTVHKHATGVTLGYLFETLALGLDDQCFEFQDGRSFCTNEEYELVFYINGEQVPDIRDYEVVEDDKVLVSYGASPEQLIEELAELEARELVR